MKDCKCILVIVKGVTVYQWIKEIQDWLDSSTLACFPITSSAVPLIPGFRLYVVSMDTFSRRKDLYTNKTLFDGVIVDECHSFKNEKSMRGGALETFFKANLLTLREYRFKRVIFLSGTPIKNRADEFYPIFHIMDRANYPSRAHFTSRWLIQDEKGKYSRIAPWKEDSFYQELSQLMIRRLKTEVATDLPPFQRYFLDVPIEDGEIKNSYNRTLDLFDNWLHAEKDLGAIQCDSLLGWLNKLRSITARAKAPVMAEIVNEAMQELPEGEKLCITLHHRDPLDILMYMCREWDPLSLTGSDSNEAKAEIARVYTDDPSRKLLFLSQLAGGVGLNLQVCNNVYALERQWNSADEEQVESRFNRIGQTRPVSYCYCIAPRTIDQYFSDMVEEKRQTFAQVVDYGSMQSFDATQDKGFLMELASRVLSSRL
jgi:SNF2 family DNA or RNA helicase